MHFWAQDRVKNMTITSLQYNHVISNCWRNNSGYGCVYPTYANVNSDVSIGQTIQQTHFSCRTAGTGSIFTFDGEALSTRGICEYELVRSDDSSIVIIVERIDDIPNSFSRVTLFWAAARVYILDRNGAKMRMVGESTGQLYLVFITSFIQLLRNSPWIKH